MEEEVKIYEKVDEKQITVRPKCDYPGCEEHALCYIHNKKLCGKHTIEYSKFENKKKMEEFFEDAN